MPPDHQGTNRSDRCLYGLREDLDAKAIEQMKDLLCRHFDGVEPKTFLRDLAEKTHVLRVWRKDRLIGFSTLLVYQDRKGEETVHILYSGDTIMDPEGWGSPVLARGWIRMVEDVKSSLPPGRCFWLLLSAGFRTYRFLPLFWREFWPRHDVPVPGAVREWMDALAVGRFGNHYHPAEGVVRFERPHRLRGMLADVPDGRRADPHIDFFLSMNPGWSSGDELVCLTEICHENLTRAGMRMIRTTKA